MDPARIAALRDVRDRDAPLNRMLRASLIRIGSLRPAGKRPARGADGRIYRGSRNRSHVVTPLGLAALATAHRLDCERVAAALDQHFDRFAPTIAAINAGMAKTGGGSP
jgi:hypothetical protein